MVGFQEITQGCTPGFYDLSGGYVKGLVLLCKHINKSDGGSENAGQIRLVTNLWPLEREHDDEPVES